MKTAQFFRCLADDLRIQIMLLLWQGGELSTTAIANILGSNESVIKRQMALLSKNQLVVFRQKELFHYYRINNDLPIWTQKIFKHTLRGSKHLLEDLKGLEEADLEQTHCVEPPN